MALLAFLKTLNRDFIINSRDHYVAGFGCLGAVHG